MTDVLVGDHRGLDLQAQRRPRPGDARQAQQQPDLALVPAGEHRRLGVEAEQPRGPPEVGLENLAHVHAARHAERVEHDVHRTAVRQERHVLFRDDARHDALVAVTAGHLVAHRDLALLGQVHLHQLDDARGQFVRLQDAVDALLGLLLDLRLHFVGRVDDLADLVVRLLVADAERLEVERGQAQVGEQLLGEPGALGDRLFHCAALQRQFDDLADEDLPDLLVAHVVDAHLLLALEPADVANPLAAVLLDHLVLDAREDLAVDDHAFHARRHLERRVLHVLRLVAEDRRQQLLLGGQLRLALRRDLAHQDVARLHVGADAHDAALVEVHQRLFRDVGDLARDLFLAALGVADVQLELLDVDRRVDVVLHQALGEHDGVLEVVAVPRHERHRHVAAEGQLAVLGGRAVGQHLAQLHLLPELDDRALVDGGVLVGAPVLLEAVAILLREAGQRGPGVTLPFLALAGVDDDLVGRHAGHHAGAPGNHHRARVLRHLLLEARADHRRLRVEERHRLALHVAAHQRAVGVVVLEERNERGGDRHHLLRRHIHIVDARRRHERHVRLLAAEHQLVDECPVGIQLGVGLGDDRVFLAVGVEPLEVAGHLAVAHDEVRRLHEAEVVDPRKAGQRRDQADVRAFRRLDGTHAPVLRVMHVADFEAGALARQAARSERREPALVRQLGQRVGLVHELRELRRAEERLDHGRHGARVDEVVERDFLRVLVDRHALLDEARHARQAHRELVGDQLAHRTDAAVAQVVDVVGVPAPLVQFHEVPQDRHEVVDRQDGRARRGRQAEALVDLVAPHAAEVVALGGEEQPLERLLGRLLVGRVARAQQRVDLLEGLVLGVRRVLEQRVLDQLALHAQRRHEDLHPVQVGLAEALGQHLLERLAGLGDHLARFRVDDVEGEHARGRAFAALDGVELVAQVDRHVRGEHLDLVDLLAAEAVEHLLGQLVAHPDEKQVLVALALGLGLLGLRLRRVIRRRLAHQLDVLGDDGADDLAVLGASLALLHQVELADREEEPQDVGVAPVAERTEQRGGRELLLLVDVHVDDVVDVDGELDPRPAERDDARRDEPLAVGVRALLEHHARRAVQLRHHHALRAVDHERAQRREQRQLAEVDFLADLVLEALAVAGILEDAQGERRLERRRIGHVPLDALLDGVLRLPERVLLELEREVLVDVGDREQVLEDPLETHVLALVGGGVELEQRLEGAHLDVEEMGHLHAAVELGERNLLDHVRSGLTRGQAKAAPARHATICRASGSGRATRQLWNRMERAITVRSARLRVGTRWSGQSGPPATPGLT